MSIHRRLIVLVGLGMLLILAVSILSFESITTVFSHTTKSVSQISTEVRKIWNIEQKIGDAARMVHEYARTGEPINRRNYETFHAAVVRMLDEIGRDPLQERSQKVLASLVSDFHTMETKAERIFALNIGRTEERILAEKLVVDLDNLVAWMNHDIERYKEENALRLTAVAQEIQKTRIRINSFFAIILVTTVGFLFSLGVYLYRKVSLPLGQLWQGAEAISRGDLNYHMRVRGESDIVKLADRFNDMAQKLKISYEDLERRLLERTKQVAALNSVALTLGGRGTLREVLQRSLTTVLANFPEMEPRGGIFLREADGEHLRLIAHVGLTPEYIAREERIRLGECLYGIVAKSGEILVSEQGCDDPPSGTSTSPSQANIIVPIKARDVVLGVIFLYPTGRPELKPSEIQMLDTVGAQLGMAIENIRLYDEIRESSEKYWDLFEKSRDILYTTDLEGNLTAVNEAMERFLSRPKHKLVGTNCLEFLNEEGKELMRRILTGREELAGRIFELAVIRPNGTSTFVEVSVRSIVYRNRPVGFQISARDVTEQKNLRELLVRAERLAAIGQVVVTVRHEINNPLTTVIGNAELLIERQEQSDSDLKRRLDLILENALRISEIVKRLQGIKEDRTIEYVKGVKMTDLGKG
jgi:PAS domain S-box-containing protein